MTDCFQLLRMLRRVSSARWGPKIRSAFAGQTWTPVECSAEIIKALVGQAMTEAGNQEVEGVVITTPAAFNQMQSEDTIAAARLAGLEKVSLLQEPVAAALAAIAHSKQKDGVFLVYDLGGGTFDLALVMSTAGVVNVIAHEGINMLGGRDFDRIIFDSIVRPWLTQTFNLPADFQRSDKVQAPSGRLPPCSRKGEDPAFSVFDCLNLRDRG